jgi:hypothetical protein
MEAHMSNGEKQTAGAEASDTDAILKKLQAFQYMLDSGIFICKNCGRTGKAEGSGDELMFNLPCNPRKTSRAELIDKLCCAACAAEIAKRRNCRLGEQGCGVYYLRLTLAVLPSEEDIAAEKLVKKNRPKWPSAQEAREKLDLEYLHWVIESQRRRRFDEIRSYAEMFAENAFDGTAGLTLPYARRWIDELFCGLPDVVTCCDREHPVRRYLCFQGEVIGLCDDASKLFIEVRRQHEDDTRYDKLLWFHERERAEQSAAKWNAAAEAATKKKRIRRNTAR